MSKYPLVTFICVISCCFFCTKPNFTPYKAANNWQNTSVKPLFKNYLGINLFEWDYLTYQQENHINEAKMERIKAFGTVRHYLDWEKIETIQDSFTFNPSHTGNWNLDIIYQRNAQEDIGTLVCLKTIPQWLINSYPENQRDYENVPAPYPLDKSKPESYIAQAKAGFQLAARYGRNKNIDPSLIKINTKTRWPGDNANELKTGLGLIEYIECDNERDKWWKGQQAYQSPEEYAANLSAFYDGHKETLGKDVGVKTADTSIQVVMGGLAVPDTNYVSRMIEWCRKYRGLNPDGSVNLCFDIINYHAYSGDTDYSQRSRSTVGLAPELSLIGELTKKFVALSREKANSIPVWVTETGYDISPNSNIRAISIGSKSALVTQADWNLRTSLLYARSGISRSVFYMLNDIVNGDPSIQFSTSGFINPDLSARPSWYYMQQAKTILGDYTYSNTIHQDPIVDVYKKGNKEIYVLTIPDQIGRTANYTLNLGDTKQAVLYHLQTDKGTAKATKVNLINGKLSVNVTETPVFVEKL
ncbi:hypothetical protein [Pedobacter xixiisoli]|uniref:Glycosyl hydrolases family 39 n=1 Tax=Pedobacter xixiisoli TaxID=1476464 RepID=A0A286A0K8_9SPHI|nr:hypothetical protein [Pedobacter xixiisoli]SOD15443.1 hypothetical protein SAMN06297358_2437 [Pedobacter xixiisoli]